jgi:hypothetical protein
MDHQLYSLPRDILTQILRPQSARALYLTCTAAAQSLKGIYQVDAQTPTGQCIIYWLTGPGGEWKLIYSSDAVYTEKFYPQKIRMNELGILPRVTGGFMDLNHISDYIIVNNTAGHPSGHEIPFLAPAECAEYIEILMGVPRIDICGIYHPTGVFDRPGMTHVTVPCLNYTTADGWIFYNNGGYLYGMIIECECIADLDTFVG